jgi:hypothetical protein
MVSLSHLDQSSGDLNLTVLGEGSPFGLVGLATIVEQRAGFLRAASLLTPVFDRFLKNDQKSWSMFR